MVQILYNYISIMHFKKKLPNISIEFFILYSKNRISTTFIFIITLLIMVFVTIYFIVKVSTISIYIK